MNDVDVIKTKKIQDLRDFFSTQGWRVTNIVDATQLWKIVIGGKGDISHVKYKLW